MSFIKSISTAVYQGGVWTHGIYSGYPYQVFDTDMDDILMDIVQEKYLDEIELISGADICVRINRDTGKIQLHGFARTSNCSFKDKCPAYDCLHSILTGEEVDFEDFELLSQAMLNSYKIGDLGYILSEGEMFELPNPCY